jgi:4-amino-4-deoxy-L-arabinose transferase-like glycosyltransferase
MTKNHDYPRWRVVLDRWWPGFVVAGLWLFHTIANWVWLSKNVVVCGYDRMGALINSLFYHGTLSKITLQTLFKASIQDEIRPPLFAASMAMMYKVFGMSTDVAVMVNAVYMAILLLASYGIGSRLGGRRLGVLSVTVVAFTPLVFAMSRYPFFEFSLAAFTTAVIYLLLASEHFEKRGFVILLGIALGLGAMLKRTFPLFVVGAIVVVLLQARLPHKLRAGLKALPRLRWRSLLLALLGGLALSALWYFPHRELAQNLNLGFWLFPIWAVVYALTIFALLQPPGAVANFASCCGLAASVASFWYVPRVSSFIERILRAGWGVDHATKRVVPWTSPSKWSYYLQSFLYGFSPVLTLLLLLALGLLLIHFIRRLHWKIPRPRWNSGWWPIIVSLGLVYFIFSASIYRQQRAIVPALPFLSVILAGALCKLPWRRLGTALAGFAIVFGLIQFFAISFTETHWLATQTRFPRTILGQSGLFAEGPFLEMPDSGINDPGFRVSPDILRRVEHRRQLEGWDSISCGILADDSQQLHVRVFAYDQLRYYPAIHVEDPTQVHPFESAYSMAFSYDYVVVLTTGNQGESLSQAVAFILGERRPWFEQAFELEQFYPLPDGREALLFRRLYRTEKAYRDGPLFDIAQYLRQAATDKDMILVYPPGLLNGVLKHYWGPAQVSAVSSREDFSARSEPAKQDGQVFLVADDGAEALRWFEAEPGVQTAEFDELSLITPQSPSPPDGE